MTRPVTSANGHVPRALTPFTVPLSGPVSTWTPPAPDTPGHDGTVVDKASRRPADGDMMIRVLAGAVVLAVAAFAAVVSYSHIFELGRVHGQDGTAARLLPLSVDGLIAAASLVMLHAARRELDVPQLARWMLGLGVGATVAANVEYGMPFGWLAAVISAWPAVAFVGSVEMAVRFVRDSRTAAAGGDCRAALAATPEVIPESVSGQAPEVTSSQVPGRPEVTVPVETQVRSRRKVQVTPGRISDADLKHDIRELHAAGRAVSVSAVAKQLGRSRDRVRPLLEEVRREVRSL